MAEDVPRILLSPRQRAALDWIKQFIAEKGVSPTLQEVADGLGVSKITVYEYVNQMEKKGWVSRGEKFSRRSIIVLDRCPACGRGRA